MLRSIRYGLYGLVLAGLVAVPAAVIGFGDVNKTVHLVVDGKGSTVTTTADHVGDLLSARGYHPSRHDLLAPAVGSNIDNGMHVVLLRGRLLHLDVDGKRAEVWTTAPTVAVALQQLGYAPSDFVSVSRSRRLPLAPTAIAIRSMRSVTIVHDGLTTYASTTQPTVAALLADLKITVGPQDRSNAAMTAAVTDGQQIVVQRVASRTVTSTVDIEYSVQKKNDASLAYGTNKVVTRGRTGQAKTYYAALFVDGKLVGRTKLRTTTVLAPRNKIVAVGTKRAKTKIDIGGPVSTSGSSASAAKKIAKELLAKNGISDQFSCVDNIFSRESGWNVHASNSGSGAYGIPQALPGSKMASAGSDWQDSAETQVKWGLNYMTVRYGSPCDAWSYWQSHNYY